MLENPIAILRRHHLKPKHSWGQNFLGDEYALTRIAEALDISKDETVVELGPGLGHLTRALLFEGAKVVAVERDRDMAAVLQAELSSPNLQVIEANAVEVNFAELAKVPRVAVVGNLPYHLSSPILFQVLDQSATVSRAVFTLQKEVVERLSASPGTRDYGLLTVLLGLSFDVESLFDIPSGAFFPPPKVDSAVVRLRALPAPRAQVTDEKHFRRVVKASFAHRRKTLINSLMSDKTLGSPDGMRTALKAAGIDATRRAETLSVEEFAALERALASPSGEASTTPR